jgi:hypothetical protein
MSVRPIPETLDEALSPEWLTDVLSSRHPGIRVTEVIPGPVVSRITTNARFQIRCEGPTPDGLSPNLCVKGYFSAAGRESRRAGLPEAYFYRDLAAETGVRTLNCVHADVDPVGKQAILITDDVVADGGRFLDGTSDYTPAETAQSLTELAALHASTWENAKWAETRWLAPRLARTLATRGVELIRANLAGPNAVGVPREARAPERLVTAYRALAAEVSAQARWCVIHGDPHVGNVVLDGAGRPSLVDWQVVQRGAWHLDVGYHIASALTVEDRRGSEQDLLRHYLDELAARGVDAPSFDEAWPAIRHGILHGFYLWAVTIHVAPPIIAALLHRLGTAVADHGVLDAAVA